MTELDESEILSAAYRMTFATEHGRRVLANLQKLSTIDRPSVHLSSPVDVNGLIRDEAQRSLVLYIMQRASEPRMKPQPETAQTAETEKGADE